MKRRLISVITLVALLTTLMPVTAIEAEPPTQIGAPQNLGTAEYFGSMTYYTVSAPDDLRELLKQTKEERGFNLVVYAQIDVKVDDGDWHYVSSWDSQTDWEKYSIAMYNSLNGGDYQSLIGTERITLADRFPEDEAILPPHSAFNGWDWYKEHSLTFRARFVLDFYKDTVVFSDWSKEFVMSDDVVMDYNGIMAGNAPSLLSSEIEKVSLNGKPFLMLQLGKHPDAVQKLNAASGNAMWTEVWLRKLGDLEFKKVGASRFNFEKIRIDVGDYFPGSIQDYNAQSYEVKLRYQMDMRAYDPSGITSYTDIFSAYSNVLSYNMPAWSAASNWATDELQKADDLGLIPDILQGADMTKPVSREEFCELAILLYETTSGKTAEPVSPNPFTDTQNERILEAYNMGITNGTSPTTFSPGIVISREQCAAMLFRTIKAINPDGDYSVTGVNDFPDMQYISNYAIDAAKYMSKVGIITGDKNGNFMPKATTTTQEAAGYGTATREQAIAMSVRIFEGN